MPLDIFARSPKRQQVLAQAWSCRRIVLDGTVTRLAHDACLLLHQTYQFL